MRAGNRVASERPSARLAGRHQTAPPGISPASSSQSARSPYHSAPPEATSGKVASCNRQGFTALRLRQCLRNSRRKSLFEKYFCVLKGRLPACRYGSCYLRGSRAGRGTYKEALGQPARTFRVKDWLDRSWCQQPCELLVPTPPKPCLTSPSPSEPLAVTRSLLEAPHCKGPSVELDRPQTRNGQTSFARSQGARYPQFK